MSGPNDAGLDKGFLATGEIRQYRAVKLDPSDWQQVEEADSAGESVLGFVQDQALAEDRDVGNRVVNVRILGITFAVASTGTISPWDKLAVTNDGRVATATGGQEVVGRAMVNSDDEGDLIQVLLTPGASLAS